MREDTKLPVDVSGNLCYFQTIYLRIYVPAVRGDESRLGRMGG